MKPLMFIHYIFGKFRSLVIANIFLLAAVGVMDALSLLSLAPVVDFLINQESHNYSILTTHAIDIMRFFNLPVTLLSFFTAFFVFNLLRSAFYLFSRYVSLKTKYDVLRDIIFGTFRDFFDSRWYFFSSSKQGMLINTFIREIIVVIGDAIGTMMVFFTNIIEMTLYLAIPLWISWKVTASAMFIAVLLALPFMLFSRLSYRLGKDNVSTANHMSSVVQESLSSAKIILGFGNQHKAVDNLKKAFEAHRRSTLKSQLLSGGIPLVYYPFGIFVLMCIFFIARKNAVPLSEVAVICYSFFRVLPSIGRVIEQKNAFNNFFPAYEQMVNLRNKAKELKQSTGDRKFESFVNEIDIKDLSFAYPNHKPILKGMNIRIPKGKMIAFVGGSGAGKSTLIDMIMGFNEPTGGDIKIDGIDLREFDINSYRSKIGYLPQESILFNMTIRDNLLWANDSATEDEIMATCRQANAEEFIRKSPKGYDTVVGDRGVRLSGGETQRIALARAILRRPHILILDEATSSLDTRSERLIQEAIEKIAKGTTVIVIAHRLSTIVNADYIYVIKDGCVAEEGTYSQLAGKGGEFYKMIKQQAL